MYTKTQIFNLAANALLLQREFINADTDNTTECRVMRNVWDTSFRQALQDMDLDSTSTESDLELIEENPTTEWLYSYRYPTSCAFFRRIKSTSFTDNRYTRIRYQITVRSGVKCVLTNELEAVGVYLTHAVSLGTLSASAGQCIALRLAYNSAPLIVGKGAAERRKDIWQQYLIVKAEAQEHDSLENFQYEDESVSSEFVAERLS